MSECVEINMNRLYSQKRFMEFESYNKEWMCKQFLRLSLFPHYSPILIQFPFLVLLVRMKWLMMMI